MFESSTMRQSLEYFIVLYSPVFCSVRPSQQVQYKEPVASEDSELHKQPLEFMMNPAARTSSLYVLVLSLGCRTFKAAYLRKDYKVR